VLRRSIDLDRYDEPIGQRISRSAKRACIVFAVSALGLSALDLANIRTAESAIQFIQQSRGHLVGFDVAELSSRIRAEIDQISLMPESEAVTVAIPRDDIAIASRSVSLVAKSGGLSGDHNGGSAVDALADLRQQDAVEFAMASPSSLAQFDTPAANDPVPIAAPRPSASMQLASVDPTTLPDTSALPPAMPISLPSYIDVLPPPAPGAPQPSPAVRLHLNEKEYARAEKCLANAIYFESRGEPVIGQEAVAQVVMNRVFSGYYPNDVCSVVYQNAERHLACQFTFACDGKRKTINERGAWARANRIAKETLDGQIYVPQVAKSTHYHAIYVRPNWVGEMKKMVRFGIHNFYRPIAWGNGQDEPVWGIGPWNKKKTTN
jgi:spore germination cell wall hydrolase CwlJ-like protein